MGTLVPWMFAKTNTLFTRRIGLARPTGRALERQRAEKAQQKAVAKSSHGHRRNWYLAGGAVVIVGAIAFFLASQPPPPGTVFPDMGNLHIGTPEDEHVPYNSSPPSSGPHVGTLVDWGISETRIEPERFVHNLEDAGVILSYDCPAGCDDITVGLEQLVTDNTGKRLLMMPYSGITDPQGTPHKGAAVAWTKVFYFDVLDAPTRREIQTFINLNEGIDHHVR